MSLPLSPRIVSLATSSVSVPSRRRHVLGVWADDAKLQMEWFLGVIMSLVEKCPFDAIVRPFDASGCSALNMLGELRARLDITVETGYVPVANCRPIYLEAPLPKGSTILPEFPDSVVANPPDVIDVLALPRDWHVALVEQCSNIIVVTTMSLMELIARRGESPFVPPLAPGNLRKLRVPLCFVLHHQLDIDRCRQLAMNVHVCDWMDKTPVPVPNFRSQVWPYYVKGTGIENDSYLVWCRALACDLVEQNTWFDVMAFCARRFQGDLRPYSMFHQILDASITGQPIQVREMKAAAAPPPKRRKLTPPTPRTERVHQMQGAAAARGHFVWETPNFDGLVRKWSIDYHTIPRNDFNAIQIVGGALRKAGYACDADGKYEPVVAGATNWRAAVTYLCDKNIWANMGHEKHKVARDVLLTVLGVAALRAEVLDDRDDDVHCYSALVNFLSLIANGEPVNASGRKWTAEADGEDGRYDYGHFLKVNIRHYGEHLLHLVQSRRTTSA